MYTIGTHMSIAGGIAKTAENVVKMNANTMQIFSRNPRGSSYKTYAQEEVEKFQQIRKSHAFGPVLAHAPYTMNLASATEKTYEFACTVIREDIRRMDELKIENLVFHPGSHTGIGEEAGITNIIRGLDQAITGTENIKVLLETMSGKGTEMTRKVVALDIETTGLDSATDEIISIGAVKSTNGEEIERFYRIIQPDKVISPKITDLTGLSQQKVEQEGISLEAALTDLRDFIGRFIVVGYNVAFDWGFIERGYDKVGQDRLGNRIIDLLKVVRQKEVFLDNFRFETVLKYYQIENQDQHNSLADADATIKLMTKLIEKGFLKI